jgi:hypothetical protein
MLVSGGRVRAQPSRGHVQPSYPQRTKEQRSEETTKRDCSHAEGLW